MQQCDRVVKVYFAFITADCRWCQINLPNFDFHRTILIYTVTCHEWDYSEQASERLHVRKSELKIKNKAFKLIAVVGLIALAGNLRLTANYTVEGINYYSLVRGQVQATVVPFILSARLSSRLLFLFLVVARGKHLRKWFRELESHAVLSGYVSSAV